MLQDRLLKNCLYPCIYVRTYVPRADPLPERAVLQALWELITTDCHEVAEGLVRACPAREELLHCHLCVDGDQ